MGIVKKITMGLLAGVTAMAMMVPAAEARNGRNAALLGGLLLGAVAGAALADSANDDGDQGADWGRPAPRYRPDPAYRAYSPPADYGEPAYSYDRGGYDDGFQYRRPHHRTYYSQDGYDGGY